MFKKLVAIEPVSLIPTAEEALHQYPNRSSFTAIFPPTTKRSSAASETPTRRC